MNCERINHTLFMRSILVFIQMTFVGFHGRRMELQTTSDKSYRADVPAGSVADK